MTILIILPSFLVLYIWRSFPIWIFLTLQFSRGRSNWSSPSFYSTTFQNFPGISELLPECLSFNTTQSYAPKVSKKKVGFFVKRHVDLQYNTLHIVCVYRLHNLVLTFTTQAPYLHLHIMSSDTAYPRPTNLEFARIYTTRYVWRTMRSASHE